jgi:hypothetical protein
MMMMMQYSAQKRTYQLASVVLNNRPPPIAMLANGFDLYLYILSLPA